MFFFNLKLDISSAILVLQWYNKIGLKVANLVSKLTPLISLGKVSINPLVRFSTDVYIPIESIIATLYVIWSLLYF